MSEAPPAQRPLGRSGLTMSPIALGCGNFGGIGSAPEFFGQGLSQDQAFALMDAAWELGITHFDTADAYGGGRSELAIGRWIASRGVRPRLTTKTYNPMRAGGDHGLSPERIRRQLRASLERLGVDRVVLFLAHEFDPEVPLPESLGALDQARSDGTILATGSATSTPPSWPPRWRLARRRRSRTATRCWRARTSGRSSRSARSERSPTWLSARWPAAGSPASTVAASRSRPGRG